MASKAWKAEYNKKVMELFEFVAQEYPDLEYLSVSTLKATPEEISSLGKFAEDYVGSVRTFLSVVDGKGEDEWMGAEDYEGTEDGAHNFQWHDDLRR